MDAIFQEFDVNVDLSFEYDEDIQGDFSESDDDVVMNMDDIDGVGITLQ